LSTRAGSFGKLFLVRGDFAVERLQMLLDSRDIIGDDGLAGYEIS
jgi:hypothetical protein